MTPTFTTAQIIERLEVLRHKLEDEGRYAGANTAMLAIEALTPRKGRPRIEDAPNSYEATKPWLALGWSRSTWYRRQAEKRKESC
jgi:hypothetical protein